MRDTDSEEMSDEVMRLVQTVERLEDEDQERILRMVNLLTLVPSEVQRRSQRMLRALLDSDPDTMCECTAGVDEVLEYLEGNAVAATEYLGAFEHTDYAPVSRQRN